MSKRFIFSKQTTGRKGSSRIDFIMEDTKLYKKHVIRLNGDIKNCIPFKIYFKSFLAYKRQSPVLFMSVLNEIDGLNKARA